MREVAGMVLEYENKKSPGEILEKLEGYKLRKLTKTVSANKLIFGDNLEILKSLLYEHDLREKINLIYIDPPFATNNIFKIGAERANTISSSYADKMAYMDTVTGSDFIEFLRERLIVMRELMSEQASIYLHIDYKIGHYVKVIMDEIFGMNNFRNDITRVKCNPKNFKRKAYGNVKDLILFYTKTGKHTWNDPTVAYTEEDLARLFKKIDPQKGKYITIPLHAPGETKNGPTGQKWRGVEPPKGRHWRSHPDELEELEKKGLIEWSSNGVPRRKIFASEAVKKGKKRQDIWEFKDGQQPIYPTEKNLDLLRNIISASSNPGDLVLDCFAGSGTTMLAAHELGRNWIGIDQSKHAIKIAQQKLENTKEDLFVGEAHYELLEMQKERIKEFVS